jgi:hypothetical protein
MPRGVALCALGLWAMTVACHDPYGVGGLRPAFVATPDTLFPGETVEVVFTLRNATRYPQTVTSSMGCLFFLETLRGDENVPWVGTDYGCAAMVTDFVIPARDSLHTVHSITAVDARTAAWVPAGTYRIRTRMSADLPELEAMVTVVDPAGGT